MNPYGKKKEYGHADIDNAHENLGVVVWALICIILFFFDWRSQFWRDPQGRYIWGLTWALFGFMLWFWLRSTNRAEQGEHAKFVIVKFLGAWLMPLVLYYATTQWLRGSFYASLPDAAAYVTIVLGGVYFPLIVMYFAGFTHYLIDQASRVKGVFGVFFQFLNFLTITLIFLSVLIPFMHTAYRADTGFAELDVPNWRVMLNDSKNLLAGTFTTIGGGIGEKYDGEMMKITQPRYTGEVERQSGRPLGVFFYGVKPMQSIYFVQQEQEEGEDPRLVVKFDRAVEWWSDLQARSFAEGFVVELTCLYQPTDQKKYQNVSVPATPPRVYVPYTGEFEEYFPFRCQIPMEDILEAANYEYQGLRGRFSMEANFTFWTWGYTTYTFLDRDTMTAVRRENRDPAQWLGIDARGRAFYTPGPIQLGMETDRQPFGVDSHHPERNFLPSFGVTIEDSWRVQGVLNRIHHLVLQVPDPMEIDVAECSGAGEQYPNILGPGAVWIEEDGRAVTVPDGYSWYAFEDVVFDKRQTFKTVRCPLLVQGDAWHTLLGPNLIPAQYTFVARTKYDYTITHPVPVSVRVEAMPQ